MSRAQSDLIEDPEVRELVQATRGLVNRAHYLSASIDATVDELREFHDDIERGTVTAFHERRVAQTPFSGDDRRTKGDDRRDR